MNGRIRIGTAIGAAAATLVLVGSAVAQTGQQSPGDLARGDALNKRYHLGKYSPAALAGPRPIGVTQQQWQAELARGDALNRSYGLGSYAATSDVSAVSTPAPPRVVTVASDGFDWSAAGIGAGAAIGLCLLASGTFIVLRQTRRSELTQTA
jgi:hypothetical protein